RMLSWTGFIWDLRPVPKNAYETDLVKETAPAVADAPAIAKFSLEAAKQKFGAAKDEAVRLGEVAKHEAVRLGEAAKQQPVRLGEAAKQQTVRLGEAAKHEAVKLGE